MKKTILRNLLVFNCFAPVLAAGQAASTPLFLKKNLHELRLLARPEGAEVLADPAHGPLLAPSPTNFFFQKTGPERLLAKTPTTALPALPPVFCEADLAFFCRLEFRVEKRLRTPVRFRLGSQEYVDYLEGKSATRLPPN